MNYQGIIIGVDYELEETGDEWSVRSCKAETRARDAAYYALE